MAILTWPDIIEGLELEAVSFRLSRLRERTQGRCDI
jgi:hypothetical protein